jgi:hypothetical protein
MRDCEATCLALQFLRARSVLGEQLVGKVEYVQSFGGATRNQGALNLFGRYLIVKEI